jgi:hypothetical protein
MLERLIAVAYLGDFVRDEEKSFMTFATDKRSSLFAFLSLTKKKSFMTFTIF